MIFSISLFIFCFYLFNRIFPSGQAAEEATLREGWFIIIFSSISFPFVLFRLFCCFVTIIALEFVAAVGLNLKKKEFHNGIFVIPPFLRFSARVI
jgi:hypothetical protein